MFNQSLCHRAILHKLKLTFIFPLNGPSHNAGRPDKPDSQTLLWLSQPPAKLMPHLPCQFRSQTKTNDGPLKTYTIYTTYTKSVSNNINIAKQAIFTADNMNLDTDFLQGLFSLQQNAGNLHISGALADFPAGMTALISLSKMKSRLRDAKLTQPYSKNNT